MGLLCVFYLLSNTTHHAEEATWLTGISNTVVNLALEMSPMLLLALFFAGLINAFMSDSFVSWLKHGNPWQQAARGMVVGIP